jgi:CheY-like chemotaxis protein
MNNSLDYKYNSVLLIDDVNLDNFLNEELLKTYNFSQKVYTNSGAKSALEFLKNLVRIDQAKEVLPEVIFVDINMPVMDGFQFIEAYKKTMDERLQKPKLVVLTSSTYEEDREKTEAISDDIIFLTKPLSKEMLEAI